MALDTTEPLKNGAELPTHPADTTAKQITRFLTVRDAVDGKALSGGLPEGVVRLLMDGVPVLDHLYRFKYANNRIYHTRKLVTIDCECSDSNV